MTRRNGGDGADGAGRGGCGSPCGRGFERGDSHTRARSGGRWGGEDPARWPRIKRGPKDRAQPVLIGTQPRGPRFRTAAARQAASSRFVGYIRGKQRENKQTKMKFLGVFVLVAVVVFAAEEKTDEERPRTFRRLIPADVLRDFPGMCFASTKCATIEPNKSWDLTPFCGRSTCIPADDDSGRLFELVEDCGPLPKANPKCKLSDKTNKTASFPECCPKFECEDGAKLEYPEIPTIPPPTEEELAAIEKAAAAAAAATVSTTPKA